MNTLNGGGCESESNDKMNVLKFGVCTARQVINSIKLVFVSYQIYDIKMRFRIENHNILITSKVCSDLKLQN